MSKTKQIRIGLLIGCSLLLIGGVLAVLFGKEVRGQTMLLIAIAMGVLAFNFSGMAIGNLRDGTSEREGE